MADPIRLDTIPEGAVRLDSIPENAIRLDQVPEQSSFFDDSTYPTFRGTNAGMASPYALGRSKEKPKVIDEKTMAIARVAVNTLHKEHPAGYALMQFVTHADPFGFRDFAVRHLGKYITSDHPDVLPAIQAVLKEQQEKASFKEPSKYAGIAGKGTGMLAEFGAPGLPEASGVIKGGAKFAAVTAAQLPTQTEENLPLSEFIKERTKRVIESAVTGAVVSKAGQVIPNPWYRVPLVTGGFMAKTSLQGGTPDQIIETGLTIIGAEAAGFIQQGRYDEAAKAAIRENPALKKVPANILNERLRQTAELMKTVVDEESAFNELRSRPKMKPEVKQAVEQRPKEGMDIEEYIAALRPQKTESTERSYTTLGEETLNNGKPINVYKTSDSKVTGIRESETDFDKERGQQYAVVDGKRRYDIEIDKEAVANVSAIQDATKKVPPAMQEPDQPFFKTTTIDVIDSAPENVTISIEKYREKQIQNLINEGLSREDAETVVITPDEYKAELKAQKKAEQQITKEEFSGVRWQQRTERKTTQRENELRKKLRREAVKGVVAEEKRIKTMGKEERAFDRWRQRMDQEKGPIGQIKRRLDTVKKKNPSRLERLRQGRLMSALTKAKDLFTSYVQKQDRMFQFGRMLDGYDDHGPITTYIIRPLRSAATRARDNQDSAMRLIRQRLDENNVNFKDLIKRKQYNIEGGVRLSGTDMTMIHLLSQNEHGMRRLRSDFSEQAIKSINEQVANDEGMTTLAGAIQEYVASRSPVFLETARNMGIDVKPEDAYITLLATNPSDIEDMPIASKFEKQFNPTLRILGKEKTIARTQTKASVEFDMTRILPNMIRGMEHFIEVGPAAKQVDSILRDKSIRRKLDYRTRGNGVKLFRSWMNDTASGKMVNDSTGLARTVQYLRHNSMLYVLGNKLLSVVPKQAISALNAIAIRPSLAPGVMTNFAKYGDLGLLHGLEKDYRFASEKSIMMKNTDWERDMRKTYNKPGMKRFFAHKKLSPFSMRWITTVDRATRTAVWKAAYDKAIVDGMPENIAIHYADDLVSQTQPMGNIEDLPAYFRGSILERTVSTFMNQPNQNWNNLRHNIWGELRAGKISKPQALQRFLIGQVLPSQVLGMISRGRLPDDPMEMLEDFAFYMVTPWYFFGRWGYNAVTGLWDPEESAVSMLPLQGFQEASGAIREAKAGKIRGAVRHTVGAIGAFTGKIPQQAIKTTEGAIDILAGETDDLRRLYYSEYMLKKNASKKEKEATKKKKQAKKGVLQ